MDTSIYRPAEFIDAAFDNLGRASLIGAILLILVLGAFTFDWRKALVGTVAIAMSLGGRLAGPVLHRHHREHDGHGGPGDGARRV